ncbi:Propionate catabolism operon regulatory protein [Burkholderia gladioli BSR3]|uniref:Propionate catabolism operon regulatory protein n=2 Tax=Burkholderia gladioli TaxID=28095 RepID=F2LR39_BURGS|nr:Propionate catabolism operon regulatory protein [Burkholderia gladioli BSR3]
MTESRMPPRPRSPRSTRPTRRRSAAAAGGERPARNAVRVDDDEARAREAEAAGESQDEQTPDLFGGLPAGGRGTQARQPSAATASIGEAAESAAQETAPDTRQGSFFDGLELPEAAAPDEVRQGEPADHEAPAVPQGGEPHPAAVAVDVSEVAQAVQDAVAGLAADVAVPDQPAPQPAASSAASSGETAAVAPKVSGAKRAAAGRRSESAPASRRRQAAGSAEPAIEAGDRPPASATVASPVDPVREPSFASGSPADPAPNPAVNPAAAPAIDIEAQLRPLNERLRAAQAEGAELRRQADREMRRVNRLLLALAVVLVIVIVALGLQTAALSSAHRDAAELQGLQQRVDRLTALQETQQADLAAAQQRADELGAQVQRLTNRLAVASRQQPAAAVRRERRAR